MKLYELAEGSLEGALRSVEKQSRGGLMGQVKREKERQAAPKAKPQPKRKEPTQDELDASEKAWSSYAKERAAGKVQGIGSGGKRNWTGD